MITFVAWIMATIITLPIVSWYLVYITSVKVTKKKNRAILRASDWTTVIFMCSVHFLIVEIWHQSMFWAILSIFFLIAILFTLMHWKMSGDIHVGKLLKGIWRFNFILFFLIYLVLSGYGLVFRIIS